MGRKSHFCILFILELWGVIFCLLREEVEGRVLGLGNLMAYIQSFAQIIGPEVDL